MPWTTILIKQGQERCRRAFAIHVKGCQNQLHTRTNAPTTWSESKKDVEGSVYGIFISQFYHQKDTHFSQGRALLDSPYYNKGTAFTDAERDTFKLEGLLPRNVQTLQEQHNRAYEQYQRCTDNLSKNTFMTSMAEQNVVLYYKLLLTHLKEMFPVVYTPTEGEAIENYSHLFRRPTGCFLDIDEQDSMEQRLKAASEGKDVRYIVVSDGEAILGLGDQGVGGILISVAKLILATACGGVSPFRTLPVVLDVGTDNQDIEQSSLYLGMKKPRTRGKEYDNHVDKFVTTAKELFPDAYIHFEVQVPTFWRLH